MSRKTLRLIAVTEMKGTHETQGANYWARLIDAYVDGELSPDDAEALRVQLDEDESLRACYQALLEMRELVQMNVEAAADSVRLEGIWEGVETTLAQEVVVDSLQLQAFVDGELHSANAATIAASVAASETARDQMAALAEIGDLLRMSAEHAADSVDFDDLWCRLDDAVGAELEAAGGFNEPATTEKPHASWWQRMLHGIGGYRSMALSVAVAAITAVVVIPFAGNNTAPTPNGDQAVEIRVVHVNEVRSEPGYNVTVDSVSGAAPVIFIRPTDSAPDSTQQGDDAADERGENGLFDDPI